MVMQKQTHMDNIKIIDTFVSLKLKSLINERFRDKDNLSRAV
jgi:hypothetical protein